MECREYEQERHPFLLDQSPHLLDRLGRAIGVIQADEIDFAAVYAALLVDHLEIGGLGATDHAIGGDRAAIGHGLPDLDFRVGDARGVFGPRGPKPRAEYAAAAAADCNRKRRVIMSFLPRYGSWFLSCVGKIDPSARGPY